MIFTKQDSKLALPINLIGHVENLSNDQKEELQERKQKQLYFLFFYLF